MMKKHINNCIKKNELGNNIKKFKTVVAIFLIFIISIGGSGCMSDMDSSTVNTSDNNSVQSYLFTKYDETFSVYDSTKHINEYYCYPDSYPDRKFTVFIDSDGSMKDDYYGFLIHDELEQRIDDICRAYFSDYKMFLRLTADYFEDDCTSKTTLDEALAKNPYQFDSVVSVFITDTDMDEATLKQLCDDIKNNNFYPTLRVYIVDEKNYYSLESDNYKQYVENNMNMVPYFEDAII